MSEPSLPEESIFAQALEIASAAERAAFLDRTCGDNQALRAEVEAIVIERASERARRMIRERRMVEELDPTAADPYALADRILTSSSDQGDS